MKCEKEFCHNQAVTDRIYCTAHGKSAQKYENHTVTRSERKTEKSSAEDDGDLFPISLNNGPIPPDETKTDDESERNIMPIQSEQKSYPQSGLPLVPSHRKNDTLKHGWNEQELIEKRKHELGENGIEETPNGNGIRSDSGDGKETPSSDSKTLSTQLNAGLLDSVTLIDSSANHLHALMKSYAKVPGQGEYQHFSPQQMHVVANLAKNLNALVRTKLDIAKEFRK